MATAMRTRMQGPAQADRADVRAQPSGPGLGVDPLGLTLGIGAGYMIAIRTAVVGVLFLPANGIQIAAAGADTTGTTSLGKRRIDHSFQLLLQICWIVTALVGTVIVWLFFGGHTPAPESLN
jgi:hypothetical protein